MANKISFFLSSLAAILASLQPSAAINFTLTNQAAATPGGVKFNTDIGEEYTTQTLRSATSFIWTIFQQNTESERKNMAQVISVFIDDVDGVGYTYSDEIHVSARYIQGYSGDVKTEMTGVLYHKMTHLCQWDGNGEAPGGLKEGVADYVRLNAGYAPSHWVQPGQGDRWDQGHDVTARFLEYCNGVRDGFVAELNKKMRNGYNDGFFVDLLGKTVDQVWAEYKGKPINKLRLNANHFNGLLIDSMYMKFIKK